MKKYPFFTFFFAAEKGGGGESVRVDGSEIYAEKTIGDKRDIQRERQTDRQREIETDRQTEIERKRQRERLKRVKALAPVYQNLKIQKKKKFSLPLVKVIFFS